MAINKWVTVSSSAAAPNQPDRADHKHTVAFATADGQSLTVAWDSAVVTNMTLWDSLVAFARRMAASQLTG